MSLKPYANPIFNHMLNIAAMPTTKGTAASYRVAWITLGVFDKRDNDKPLMKRK
jgi:hypothetical protein